MLKDGRRGVSGQVLEAETIDGERVRAMEAWLFPVLGWTLEVAEAKYGNDLIKRLFEDSVALYHDSGANRQPGERSIVDSFARVTCWSQTNLPTMKPLDLKPKWLAEHFNHKTHLVPKRELYSEIGSDAYYGGLVDETSAGLNPAQYVVGLANAAERAGAVLCSRARLIKLRKSLEGFQLKTKRGGLVASEVLVTTGGYTGRATPKLQRRIIPIGSYIIATQPLPKNLVRELNPHNRMIFDYKHFLNYFRLSADNRMVFGRRRSLLPRNSLQPFAKALRSCVER